MSVADHIKNEQAGFRCAYIGYEWPHPNMLWKRPETQKMIKRFDLKSVKFHGCKVGLLASTGKPHKKPWMLQTDMPELIKAFAHAQCDHKPVEHEQVRGNVTTKTRFYPKPMCNLIRHAVRKQIGYDMDDPHGYTGVHGYVGNDKDATESDASDESQAAPSVCPCGDIHRRVVENDTYHSNVQHWTDLFTVDKVWIFYSGCPD